MGKGLDRRRGEGNTEYVVLLTFVLICAVVGLFTSYSGALKRAQLEKGLCLDCTDRDSGKYGQTSSGSTNNSSSGKNEDLSNNRSTNNDSTNSNSSGATANVSAPANEWSWWNSLRDLVGWWLW